MQSVRVWGKDEEKAATEQRKKRQLERKKGKALTCAFAPAVH